MSTLSELIDDYLAAYCEPDRARRAELVRRVWATQAKLVDPPLTAQGHAEIAAQADALLGQFPDHRFRRSSGIDAHHGQVRYSWQLLDTEGKVKLEGTDFAQFDDRGCLAQVTGFFGPLPQHEGAPRS